MVTVVQVQMVVVQVDIVTVTPVEVVREHKDTMVEVPVDNTTQVVVEVPVVMVFQERHVPMVVSVKK
jgi:hypothetical protein